MPLTAPDFDTRTFDQLVEAARARISSYTPEWTDFNHSDPGMAIVDLFAWFTELRPGSPTMSAIVMALFRFRSLKVNDGLTGTETPLFPQKCMPLIFVPRKRCYQVLYALPERGGSLHLASRRLVA